MALVSFSCVPDVPSKAVTSSDLVDACLDPSYCGVEDFYGKELFGWNQYEVMAEHLGQAVRPLHSLDFAVPEGAAAPRIIETALRKSAEIF
ncbi:hypothetical protein KUG47_10205 [Falsochrobactrum sp. TDYN1]|uniref:Uncharacterized protein n=1 Tax=Falsochrobactrum tianjinense TaxID=2706015 RepID=A0A949UV17_9HYPH|nr:hypothetical protein [Falsochrobactrum sp. TDYN1]MBV2143866.1 hypothetical protein [Falsochrobactrum sp. TDYN1]